MELIDAIQCRHAVRKYTDEAIEAETLKRLQSVVERCNAESGLNIQLVVDEPKAFAGGRLHYGMFENVRNYLALIGPKADDLDEKCGYYGEQVVLEAQCAGLNSCWVGLTYSKVPDALRIANGEKLVAVVALGYGQTQGVFHKSKTPKEVTILHGNEPQWFHDGVAAALLAPTAMNQQKFRFELIDGKVSATTKWGPFSKVDLGIAKCHFEIGAAGPIRWA